MTINHLQFSVDHVGYAIALGKEISAEDKRVGSMHAQAMMRELGITYQHGYGNSAFQTWEFWNCENVPSILPCYLSAHDTDPMTRVSRGLNQEQAESIRDYKRESK